MQDCWQEDPNDRPTFEDLRDELKEMKNQHQVTCEHLVSPQNPDSFYSVVGVDMHSQGGIEKFPAVKKRIFLVDDLGDFIKVIEKKYKSVLRYFPSVLIV